MNEVTGKARALAVILLALSWPAAEHLTSPPDGLQALVLSLGGLLLLVCSTGAARVPHRLGRLDLVMVAALAGWEMVTAAGPARLLYGVALVCLVVSLTPPLRRSNLAGSLSLGGLALTVSGASTSVLKQVAWRLHEVHLGLPGASLEAWTGERLATVGITFEALGLYFIWYLAVALCVLAALSLPWNGWRRAARALVFGAGVLAVYACLRLAVTVVLAVEFDRPDLLWQPGFTIASWLPLSLFLGRPRPYCRPPYRPAVMAATVAPSVCERRFPERRWLAYGAAVAAGLCVAFAAAYNDPGAVKPGRILIDDGHADWEWTDEPFDTTAFGIRAEYNYYCPREYLSHFYAVSTADTISGVLENVDVLVIRTPTDAYSEKEIDDIVEFVKRGGGLLLIGDHTNLFGMTTYLNAIATRFGMRFGFDDTFDLASTGFSTYQAGGPPYHPAIRNLKQFDFLTSCTMTGGISTEPVMVGCGLASEDAAYSHPNFFGNMAFDLCDRFGVFLQAASRRFGDGRVFLFTDSTCFSNFCLFAPGKCELLLGAIDYLNRRGRRLPWVRPASLLVAAVLVGLVSVRRTRPECGAGIPWLAAMTAFFLGVPFTAHLSAFAYGSVRPVLPLSPVVFDTEHSGVTFFDYLGVDPLPASQHFEEFYLCAQRLGLHPKAGSVRDLEADTPLALVVVNPSRSFARDDIDRVFEFVSGGGTLLVLDSVTNPTSTAEEILRPFGLGIRVVAAAVSLGPAVAWEPGGRQIVPSLQAFAQHPGSGWVQGPAGGGRVMAEVGSGRVVVATDAFRYSSSVLGRPLDRRAPQGDRRLLYSEIHALYRHIRASLKR